MKKQRVVYFGSPEFSLPPLKTLYLGGYEIVGIYTQEPKKKFRGQKKINSPIHHCANELKISVRCPEKLDDIEYNFIMIQKNFILKESIY